MLTKLKMTVMLLAVVSCSPSETEEPLIEQPTASDRVTEELHTGYASDDDLRMAAFEELRSRAESGNPNAQVFLAEAYGRGMVGGINLSEAARWYRRAAEQGHGDAQYRLAAMARSGNGMPQNPAEALRLYTVAAEGGHLQAQFALAEMLAHDPSHINYAEAVRWYQTAAERGHPGAQYALATRFERGEGVEQNLLRAHMWFNLHAAFNESAFYRDIGASDRERIEALLTPAEIAEAQALAQRCIQSEYQNCG